MNYGYQNEYDFVKLFNDKHYSELNKNSKQFLYKLFDGNIDIDAFVSGTVDDYVWLLKYDVYDLILSKRCNEYTSPHIACITLGPKKEI